MSDVIKLLPDSVANQIAAGEVIQRPASVIKELVENSVDSGATRVEIIIRDAGKTLIQVVDNGCGMSDTDARLAFERHATSKIRQASDLFELHTMGFRGEALPSIAAVAQVELDTMRADDTLGSHLVIEGSKFISQTPQPCRRGTNLKVKNLFFNFPARRKFLKRDTVELSHIMHEFERLALVNPGIEFVLTHNDVTLHQLLPASLKGRIAALFGKSLDRQLIPVATETPIVKISGFVCLPENARRRNALQYLFVNGRNMRHPYFHRAILGCYEDLIGPEQQPNYFLDFEVDPQTIDVNIHPTKSEIKFENEAPIWQILQAAIRESLGKFNAVPSIDFDRDDAPDIPAFDPTASHAATLDITSDYNPFAPPAETAQPAPAHNVASRLNGSGDRQSWQRAASAVTGDWQRLYDSFQADHSDLGGDSYNPFAPENSQPQELPAAPATLSAPATAPDGERLFTPTAAPTSVIQLADRYLVSPGADGLIIVDRHRAHLKVLYEQFMADSATGGDRHGESQQVLFPEILELSAAQDVILQSISEEITRAGFRLERDPEEPRTWTVNGVPSALVDRNPRDLLLEVIGAVADETATESAASDAVRRAVALSLARAGAVRPGTPLPYGQAEKLLATLFSLPDPALTPDGHPTLTRLTLASIASALS